MMNCLIQVVLPGDGDGLGRGGGRVNVFGMVGSWRSVLGLFKSLGLLLGLWCWLAKN